MNIKSIQTLWRNQAYDISEWKQINKIAFPVLLFCTILLIGNLLFYYLSPYGKVTNYNFVQNLPGSESYASLNKNGDKLELGGTLIKTKTTRFATEAPNKLNKVSARLAYKPGQKEIKLGVRGSESEPFIYKSLFFDPLNSLSWERVEQNGLVLYQKNKQYESIAEFLNQIPSDKKIGTYQVDTNLLVPYVYPRSLSGSTVITTPIRGSLTAYVLQNDKDLKISVTKQDMNMYEGADSLQVSVSLANVKVSEAMISDDGFADKSKSQTAPQTTAINVSNAKPGVYKIDFNFESASNDSVITKIEINQTKVIFDGGVLIWNDMPTTLYASSAKLTASTSWPESIQNLKVDDKADLPIKDIKNKFTFDMAKVMKGKPAGELYKIFSPKGNVNLESDGYFAFSPAAYFDPQLIKTQILSANMSASEVEKNFDYILTTVAPAKDEDYWLKSEVSFSESELPKHSDKLFFSLEIPEIDKQGGSLEVGSFDVQLSSK